MVIPRVALLVIGDGRDELRAETVASWHAQARDYDLAVCVNVDDRRHELGFCGAIRYGWDRLRDEHRDGSAFEYVFHLEEDFRFERIFNIAGMTRLLDAQPRIAQVALRRGPVNSQEFPDITDAWPRAYALRMTHEQHRPAHDYLEHRLNWTTNPCVYRRALIQEYEWPEPPRCEEAFGETLLTDGYSFAYWGGKGAPWVTHTGHERTGGGY